MSNKVEDVLKSKSIDYDIKTGLEPNELKSIIDSYDGILIRSATKLTADILENCSNLKLSAGQVLVLIMLTQMSPLKIKSQS